MNADCEPIRLLLFEVVDGGVSLGRRAEVAAHLVTCEECRNALAEERALSEILRRRPKEALLRRPSPFRHIGSPFRHPGRAAAVLLLATALFLGTGLLGGTPAYGSITPSTLSLSMTFESGATKPLSSHNHFEVPLDSVHSLDLTGCASLRVAGPAVLDLDWHGEAGWKLTLLRGRVQVHVEEAASLTVTSLHGLRELIAGSHVVSLDPGSFTTNSGESETQAATERFHEGLDLFFEEESMAEAEQAFRAVLENSEIDIDLHSQALFYLFAALGRQNLYAAAIEAQEQWLQLDVDRESRSYVLYFKGLYHQALGEATEAAACWETIRVEEPDSELIEWISPEPGDGEGGDGAGPYLVVTLGLAEGDPRHEAFAQVAEQVAEYHGAEHLEADPDELDSLEKELASRAPEQVLYVLYPELLDLNLHRRLLLSSARLDEDPLPDFTFGYFTHAHGAGLRELWRRTKQLHEEGLRGDKWVNTFVTSGMKSTIWASYLGELEKAAGFEGPGIGFAIVEDDPECKAFVAEKLPLLEDAAVIQLTGNGDPQGIWLFDDHRNIDSAKHWNYAPGKVGHDPDGELPRVMAAEIAALELDAPILWSGTCHSGATCRVFVEGDIVSTFGTTDRVTVHELSSKESLCLAFLEAGATALLVPIAANHGFSVDLESNFALREGATLGETIKSTWDDVFLAAGGELVLDLPVPGEPHAFSEAVMQGGGANRILIGDPALRPFAKTDDPRTSVSIESVEGGGGFDVQLEWDEGFHARAWDIYGTHSKDWRIGERIDVTDRLAPTARIEVTVQVTDSAGEELDGYELTRAELEHFHGRLYLHLQANADREVGDGAKTARFRVRPASAEKPR